MMSVGPIVGLTIMFTIFLAFAIPVAILWLIVVAIRNLAGGPPRPPWSERDPAAEELRYRFARGELSQAQFEDGMRAFGYEKRP